MAKKSYKPTKADFEAFKAECERLRVILGMVDWRFYYEFVPKEGAFATYEAASDLWIAGLALSTEEHKGVDAEDFDPIDSARHEIAHVLVARLGGIARSRYIRPDDIQEEEERLARLIGNVLLSQV